MLNVKVKKNAELIDGLACEPAISLQPAGNLHCDNGDDRSTTV